jgi:hypothetical protein
MIPADQTLQQMTVRVEDIDEPRTAIGFLVRFLMALLGVRDVQLSAEVLDVEWRIAVGNIGIAE